MVRRNKKETVIKTTTRWRCRLAKEGNAPRLALKLPQAQSQAENGTALKSTASGQKDFADLPLPGTNSYLHHTQTATRTPSS